MSRKAFGSWGAQLSDREFGQALAAIGLLNGKVDRPLSRSKLTRILDEATGIAGNLWDASPATARAFERLLRTSPEDLAAAWAASYAQEGHLPIHPVAGLDGRWLFDVLRRALTRSLPWFELPEPPGRLRWSWPTLVGFRTDDAYLEQQIYERLSDTIANLTSPEVGATRSDILLTVAGRWQGISGIVAAGGVPEASLVVVFAREPAAATLPAARQLARRANARAVALVMLPQVPGRHRDQEDRQLEWFRSLIRELSHNAPLLPALREAGHVVALLAAPSIVEAVPLRLAGERMAVRLERSLGMTASEPPPPPAPPAPPPVAPMPAPTVELPDRTAAALGLPADEPVGLPDLLDAWRGTDFAYSSEGEGATDVALATAAAEPAIAEEERAQTQQRFIRTAIDAIRRGGRAERVESAFLAGTRHRLGVSIGPRERGLIVATEEIAETVLADLAGHRLTVVVSEPDLLRRPLVGSLELPAVGASEAATFELPVRRDTTQVRARISISHRGRILQTAILRGPVVPAGQRLDVPAQPGIELIPEANLRPGLVDLDERTRFHAALVLNHDDHGRAGGTAIGRMKAVQFGFDFVKDALAGLTATLDEAEQDDAFNRPLGSAKSLRYLRKLALQGRTLHTAIGRRIEQVFPGKLERIQVLSTNANTMLPVELIYDLDPPTKQPKLCSNANEALRTGRCKPAFHTLDDEGFLDVICPAGFWGISKVIEREAADPTRPGAAFEVVRSAATRDRNTLGPLRPLLFAASDHVNDVNKGELKRIRTALAKLTNKQVTSVERWKDWAKRVREDEPPVLVLLSHTELEGPDGAALEIAKAGGPELRAVAEITKNYVNLNPDRPGPIVLLLGCTTAVPLDTFQTFVVQFKDMGASLVVGTIAPVLGRHASRTAEALIEQLDALTTRAAASRRKGVPIGEALRDVRRDMLAKGILMSMSLAAYGDADWRLPTRST